MIGSNEEDCLVMFSFPRYSEINYSILELAKKRGSKIILITDRVPSLLIKTGVGDTAVKRIKKMYAGRVIRGYNSIEAIVNAQADLAISGFSLIDTEKAIADITSDKINSMALEAFKRSNAYLSVIK